MSDIEKTEPQIEEPELQQAEAPKTSPKIFIGIAIGVVLTAGAYFGYQYMNPGGSSNSIQTVAQNSSRNTGIDPTRVQDRTARMKSNLAPLVKTGTITQGQADKIVDYMTKNMPQRRFDRQADGYFQQGTRQQPPSGEKTKSPLAELVTDKILTQAQADAVAKVLFQGGGRRNNGYYRGGPGQGQPPGQSQSAVSS